MKKKYDLNHVYVGKADIITKNNNLFYYPGWSSVKALITASAGYKIFFEENKEYYDLDSLKKIYNRDNIADITNCNTGNFVISDSYKKIPFLKFIEMGNVTYDGNNANREQIFELFNKTVSGVKMSNTKTLAIIKPDGMKNIDKIIDMLYRNGLTIKEYKVEQLTDEILEKHYSHLLDKPFYPKLRNYMMSAPVAIMILEGENAVKKLRKLMGPTDATKAEPDTIRGKFGTDLTYNAIHGSDSDENAKIEIERFFKTKQKRI